MSSYSTLLGRCTLAASWLLGTVLTLGCGGPTTDPGKGNGPPPAIAVEVGKASGEVAIDGSSTVYPISSRAAEQYEKAGGQARVTVGTPAGTGGGFKKFIAKDIDICDASRPITEDEKKKCDEAGVEYVVFEVGIDGLAVLTNPQNELFDCLTYEQLKKIWDEGSTVKTWKDVDASWPDEPIKLFGPDDQSGTFDYFTEAINGKSKKSRSDFTQSSDDNVLVTGITGSKYTLGYFGYSYYESNKNKIKLLKVSKSGECVLPTNASVLDGTYPLSRPLFIYVNKDALRNKPAVKEFVKFYLANAQALATKARYVSPTEATVKKNLETFDAETK